VTATTASPSPITEHFAGRSINSALFSPSGSTLVSVTQSNTLDIYKDLHLVGTDDGVESSKTNKAVNRATSRPIITKPKRSIKHDNQTGRWLSTFITAWHPQRELFICGSMAQPRRMELFDDQGTLLRGIQGEQLSAVTSRCDFHPSLDKLIMVGGNSSGRVTIIR